MDEVLKIVIANFPMLAGLVLCIVILKLDLDHERTARRTDCQDWQKEREAMQSRLDQTQSKLVDVALNCHDESIKADALTWTPNQVSLK